MKKSVSLVVLLLCSTIFVLDVAHHRLLFVVIAFIAFAIACTIAYWHDIKGEH